MIPTPIYERSAKEKRGNSHVLFVLWLSSSRHVGDPSKQFFRFIRYLISLKMNVQLIQQLFTLFCLKKNLIPLYFPHMMRMSAWCGQLTMTFFSLFESILDLIAYLHVSWWEYLWLIVVSLVYQPSIRFSKLLCCVSLNLMFFLHCCVWFLTTREGI